MTVNPQVPGSSPGRGANDIEAQLVLGLSFAHSNDRSHAGGRPASQPGASSAPRTRLATSINLFAIVNQLG